MGTKSLEIIQAYSFQQNVSELRRALDTLVPGFDANREPVPSTNANRLDVKKGGKRRRTFHSPK